MKIKVQVVIGSDGGDTKAVENMACLETKFAFLMSYGRCGTGRFKSNFHQCSINCLSTAEPESRGGLRIPSVHAVCCANQFQW